jgi:glucose uptake protein
MFCIVTMLCWGSWANTQKLSSDNWRFELYYWDYGLGILLSSLLLAFTFGSQGAQGRPFLSDISQADLNNLRSAFIGGIVFNVANMLLVAAIGIAGMAVAFPVGIGLALVLGVLVNYLAKPEGDFSIIATGVALISVAILLNANAYQKISGKATGKKGLLLSIVAGSLMGLFYQYVAASMTSDFSVPETGKLTPYTALVVFSFGLFLSSFILNTLQMKFPFRGKRLSFSHYLKGTVIDHLVGLFGGFIWFVGMAFSILASEKAGPALSYGLGQGATLVAALWGIYFWKEFKEADIRTHRILRFMLVFYACGLGLLILSK